MPAYLGGYLSVMGHDLTSPHFWAVMIPVAVANAVSL